MWKLKPGETVGFGTAMTEMGRGGIASVARMSVQTLLDAGHPVSVTSYHDKSTVDLDVKKFRACKGKKLPYALGLNRDSFNVSHFVYDCVGMARPHPQFPFRRPYAVWIHGIEVWNSLTIQRERALKNADIILVNSQFTLNKFQDLHFELPNASICHLATENSGEAKLTDRQFESPPRVLILARISKTESYKGHKELIEAWPQILRAVPNAKLEIVGSGDGIRDLQSLVASLGLGIHITFHGFLSAHSLRKVWEKIHVFAMPSRGEGFGLVYTEAMSRAIPVIASTHDAGQEVNIDGVTGFNVDLNLPNQLAERLIDLLSDKELLQALGKKGYDHWRDNFQYDAFRERLLKVIL